MYIISVETYLYKGSFHFQLKCFYWLTRGFIIHLLIAKSLGLILREGNTVPSYNTSHMKKHCKRDSLVQTRAASDTAADTG